MPYSAALADWLACASAGGRERAAQSARAAADGLEGRVAFLGTAGHVLDFDDTYLPGLAHLSAGVAPAALGVAAHTGATVSQALDAYAAGFEAMGALARASHPGLYERGWHPTAVCAGAGAATAAARLLGLDAEREATAVRLALLRAGGLRAAFGSDGKALQVGMAAAAGVSAARLAAAGAVVGPDVPLGPAGFADVLGGGWPAAGAGQEPAIQDNWIKPWPCCLMAHSAIEAATQARERDPTRRDRAGAREHAAITLTVHPRAREAATYDDVADGLQAKFSIPYLVAYTLLHGEPRLDSFDGVDDAARALASRITIRTDPSLGEAETVLEQGDEPPVSVAASRGSPERPLSESQLAAKVESLGGAGLNAALDDPSRSAAEALDAAGLL